VPKTERLTIRIDPIVKDALRKSAEREHRSIANLLELLIRRHSSQLGIPTAIPKEQAKK